jgi:hypothetical protein
VFTHCYAPRARVARSGCRARAAGPLSTLLCVLLAVASDAQAAGVNDVHGVVHDAQHRPLVGAAVQLSSASSAWSRSVSSSAAGEFAFSAVPVGDYLLSVTLAGFARSSQTLSVTTGGVPSLHVQLASGEPTETVTVSASVPGSALSVTPTTLISRADIANTPGADRTNSLAMITNYVPGAYFVHDQLHVRGGHQVSWEIDGVEIPNTNIASNLGPQVDPKDIDYLEAQGGSYPADEGDRTYGVFNVVPRNGFERDSEGELIVSGGNFAQTNDAISIGSHTDNFAYYASATGNRSDLGLMTPVAAVLHDAADGYGAFSTLIYNAGADDQLRLVLSARRDDYEIPNSPGEIASDVEREADALAIASWLHTFSQELSLTSSLFYHYNRADYDGGSADYPISTTAQHSSAYAGVQENLRFTLERNDLAAGFYAFNQADIQDFHLGFNDDSSAPISEALRPHGKLWAAYVQDSYHANSWLTLAAGVRQTHFAGLLSENATDPRLGATVKLPGVGWILRGFWGEYYQAPPLTTLSGPLLDYAQQNSLGFLPLRGERDREWQFGVSVPLRGWSIDVDHFRTVAHNFFDHNPLGNSDVFIPITITGALIEATEVALRSPRLWNSLQLHLAYANQTADGSGTITGGLTDFSPPGGSYALDHDQRNTLNLGLDAQLPWRAFAAMNLYYGSGFSNGDAPPSHLPSHASLDLTGGRNFGRDVSVSVTVLNATNRHLLVDNSLTFDGFHYDNPREIFAQVRYRFGY